MEPTYEDIDPAPDADPIDAAVDALALWMASYVHNTPISANTHIYNAIHFHAQSITSELHKLKGN